MQKIRFWLIKKLIGNTPVIMNVTLNITGSIEIQGAKEEGLFDKWHVEQIEQKQEEEKQNDKTGNRNTRRKNARTKR